MSAGSIKNITRKDIETFISAHEPVLKATQPKLCIPIIDRIYKKMKAGIYFTPLKVDGSLLCDGHHRYIASLLSGKEIEKVPTLSASSVKAIQWADVVFEEDEWDTEAKINMLNEQDALYNGIALQKLLALLQ